MRSNFEVIGAKHGVSMIYIETLLFDSYKKYIFLNTFSKQSFPLNKIKCNYIYRSHRPPRTNYSTSLIFSWVSSVWPLFQHSGHIRAKSAPSSSREGTRPIVATPTCILPPGTSSSPRGQKHTRSIHYSPVGVCWPLWKLLFPSLSLSLSLVSLPTLKHNSRREISTSESSAVVWHNFRA